MKFNILSLYYVPAINVAAKKENYDIVNFLMSNNQFKIVKNCSHIVKN